MFSSGPNYTKLKTHLRLSVNRLKLLEKKKTELAQKARKEIADCIATNKVERARIRVEHIIREDYLVEAMEIVEMYCDLLLARFGLITQMKGLDDGIAEAVSSLVWVTPRLQSDVSELKVISDIFISKYGKEFTENARTATGEHHVSEKLMHKLAIQAPPKLLVEKYLIEIAKNYNIEYEPDPQVMKDDMKPPLGLDNFLIDLSDRNNLGGNSYPPAMGFVGYPQPPQLPDLPDPPTKPFNYPPPYGGGGGSGGGGAAAVQPPFAYNIPPQNPTKQKDLNVNSNFIYEERNNIPPDSGSSPEDNQNAHYESLPPRYSLVVNANDYYNNIHKPSIKNINLPPSNNNNGDFGKPSPKPRTKFDNAPSPSAPPPSIPNLPSVPDFNLPEVPNSDVKSSNSKDDDEIDFDDLTKRFERLKKFK